MCPADGLSRSTVVVAADGVAVGIARCPADGLAGSAVVVSAVGVAGRVAIRPADGLSRGAIVVPADGVAAGIAGCARHGLAAGAVIAGAIDTGGGIADVVEHRWRRRCLHSGNTILPRRVHFLRDSSSPSHRRCRTDNSVRGAVKHVARRVAVSRAIGVARRAVSVRGSRERVARGDAVPRRGRVVGVSRRTAVDAQPRTGAIGARRIAGRRTGVARVGTAL